MKWLAIMTGAYVVLFLFLAVSFIFVVLPSFGAAEEFEAEITSRTEYIGGDEGQVITEVRYIVSGNPAPATCYATALYPNKTALFSDQAMTNISFGTHHYDFTVPAIEGVYEYQTRCELGSRNVTRSKAFHVSGLLANLTQQISEIPRVNFLHEGVNEVRLNKWNVNSWRIEGEGTITGVECYITEAPLFATEYLPPSEENLIEACELRTDPALTAYYANYGANIYGLYNLTECLDASPRQCPTPSPSEIDLYTAPSGGQASMLIYNETTTGQGIDYYADMGYMTAEEFDRLDCGFTQTHEPNWVEPGDPSGVNNTVGQAFCYLLDEEGFKAKTHTTLRQDCVSVGCLMQWDTVLWAGCGPGAFIKNSDKWVGVHWYSNSSSFAYGNNYEIRCDVDYELNGRQMDHDGLRQYVYVTNEGKIRAVHVK